MVLVVGTYLVPNYTVWQRGYYCTKQARNKKFYILQIQLRGEMHGSAESILIKKVRVLSFWTCTVYLKNLWLNTLLLATTTTSTAWTWKKILPKNFNKTRVSASDPYQFHCLWPYSQRRWISSISIKRSVDMFNLGLAFLGKALLRCY